MKEGRREGRKEREIPEAGLHWFVIICYLGWWWCGCQWVKCQSLSFRVEWHRLGCWTGRQPMEPYGSVFAALCSDVAWTHAFRLHSILQVLIPPFTLPALPLGTWGVAKSPKCFISLESSPTPRSLAALNSMDARVWCFLSSGFWERNSHDHRESPGCRLLPAC